MLQQGRVGEFARTRATLNESKVLAIFGYRGKKPAKEVSAMYSVCEKTVRDVWSGRTWSHVTKAVPRKLTTVPEHQNGVECAPQTENSSQPKEEVTNEPLLQGGLQPFVNLIFTQGTSDVDRMLEYWDQGYDVLLPLEDCILDEESELNHCQL
mmetsp:Transcript_51983/g.135739  ORF Transcript_51983/g.135739 Transcript_51983/m.135739 type:complete len:153 (-) Transcript_51983:497-955(-)